MDNIDNNADSVSDVNNELSRLRCVDNVSITASGANFDAKREDGGRNIKNMVPVDGKILEYYFYTFVCAAIDIIPVRLLYVISKLNWDYYLVVVSKLEKYKKLYMKYSPLLANKYYKHLLANPITYDNKIVTVEKFTEMVGDRLTGVKLFNPLDVPFKETFLQNNRVAISNVTLWMRNPVACTAIIMINGYVILMKDFEEKDYTYIGHGLQFINLNMPGELNPILLGEPILGHDLVKLCLVERTHTFDTQYGESVDAEFHIEFMYENVDRVVVSYVTTSEDHNWSDYIFAFNGDFDSQWKKFSFIRERNDKKISVEETPTILPADIFAMIPNIRDGDYGNNSSESAWSSSDEAFWNEDNNSEYSSDGESWNSSDDDSSYLSSDSE